MSEPKDVAIKEGDPEWEAMRENYLDELIENFSYTGNFEKLRTFVRYGGEIDKYGLREIVADMMELDFTESPNGKKDAEMISFYMSVCARVMSARYQEPDKRNTTRSAIKYVAKHYKPHPIEFKTAEKRFSEGRKRFIKKFNKPWIET